MRIGRLRSLIRKQEKLPLERRIIALPAGPRVSCLPLPPAIERAPIDRLVTALGQTRA